MDSLHFEAVIFDLDGVITKTAQVHSAAWKKMFDTYLQQRSERYGEPFREFSHQEDYLPYVDGKPRYQGVESFLISRGIELPFGTPDDPPEMETVCALGNRKNIAFNEVLEEQGVEVFGSTVSLIHDLKQRGIHIAVASSSKNCRSVLERAGLDSLFETRVDGEVSAELGLKGKPNPDIFTTASDRMGIGYDRSVVVEDAVSGVQAGKAGNFGLVIGIAREHNETELSRGGADLVVKDLSELTVNDLEEWFGSGLEEDGWCLSYPSHEKDREGTRETLLTVGNGYFATRGAPGGHHTAGNPYPATYIAGLYNRLTSKIAGRDIENEDFVRCPDWTRIDLRIGNDDWIDLSRCDILMMERRLDFRSGILSSAMKIRDSHGRITRIESERWAGMDQYHIGGSFCKVTPVNYSDMITVRSGIDGNIINDGVARYRQLNQKHLEPTGSGCNDGLAFVTVRTVQSNVEVAMAARHQFHLGQRDITPLMVIHRSPGMVMSEIRQLLEQSQTLEVKKKVAIYTSREWDSRKPLEDALRMVDESGSYEELKEKSTLSWADIWKRADVRIEGDRLAQKLIRLHIYHLMVSFSPHNDGFDAGITARGLHGEAYRGHVFWDELFILPFYAMHFPEAAVAALMYRYRRLDKAREYAREMGYEGALFPWQSGSDGREETQVIHLNPLSGKWDPDHSSLQRHVSLAIAWNIRHYVHVTGDLDFLENYGLELYLSICRCWASMAKQDPVTGRYSISGVMGPDEFHEKYPGMDHGGLKDNAYTNIMVAWMFRELKDLMEVAGGKKASAAMKRSGTHPDDIVQWMNIGRLMNIVMNDDIIAQYDGYFGLDELDWDYYRNKYGNIYRMDRLLKAEGKSPDVFKVAKQADTLQLFYNLDIGDITSLLGQMGYELSPDYPRKNLEYYLRRTSHGSTLSRVVHAHLANMTGDMKLSWELYLDALTSDYRDVQGGTTAEGIHAGVMAGTILVALQSYAGVNLRSDIPRIDPALPEHWRSIGFGFSFRNTTYLCTISREGITISQSNPEDANRPVIIQGKGYDLKPSQELNIRFKT